MWGRIDGFRVVELGVPGDQRTWLTDLVLSGAKTATAGLLELDYEAEDEPLEHVGERLVLVDDEGSRAASAFLPLRPELFRCDVAPALRDRVDPPLLAQQCHGSPYCLACHVMLLQQSCLPGDRPSRA
ncbi:hypothetical protein AB0H88_52020 [Nonomuraea sp. NPDC050680]|uniref:hypothetical protein n=1 Tax=Nonomuraea sp. NPDC050680 TaxID=3154630 RepID=UPI0033C3940F